MMLRALFVLLLVLNALFLAWSQGWLDPLLGPGSQREPARLRLEAHAERMQLLSPQAVSSLQTRSCLELGPLAGEEALRNAQATLERLGLSSADWQLQSREQPGLWAVATIKLGNAELRARKEEVYRKQRIAVEALQGLPEEQPSLLLSRHDSAKAAEAALAAFERRALKDLRVLQLQPALSLHQLKVPHADGALRAQLAREGGANGLNARACAPEAPAGAGSSAPASAAR